MMFATPFNGIVIRAAPVTSWSQLVYGMQECCVCFIRLREHTHRHRHTHTYIHIHTHTYVHTNVHKDTDKQIIRATGSKTGKTTERHTVRTVDTAKRREVRRWVEDSLQKSLGSGRPVSGCRNKSESAESSRVRAGYGSRIIARTH